MKRMFAVFVVGVLVGATSYAAPQASTQDNSSHEFLMSCTYGVLAGTLVGAASLAFTSQPGQNLNIVARGASLGLYAGILSGLYVVYIVPSLEGGPEEEPIAKLDRLPFMLSPILHDGRTLAGLQADWTVFRW